MHTHLKQQGEVNTMDLRKVKIVDIEVKWLGGYSDEYEDWTSEYEIFFLIQPSFEVEYKNEIKTVDRLAMLSDWGNHTYVGLANKEKVFYGLKVHNILLNKLLDSLDHYQAKGNKLQEWEFRYDIIETINDNHYSQKSTLF